APSFDANHPLTAASMSSITSACVEAGSPTMQMLAGAPPLCGPPPLGGPPPAGGPPPLGGPPPVFGPATKVPPTFMGAPPPLPSVVPSPPEPALMGAAPAPPVEPKGTSPPSEQPDKNAGIEARTRIERESEGAESRLIR